MIKQDTYSYFSIAIVDYIMYNFLSISHVISLLQLDVSTCMYVCIYILGFTAEVMVMLLSNCYSCAYSYHML